MNFQQRIMASKHCDHPKRKLNSNLGKIIESLFKLEDVNVSYHLVVHMQGTSQSFGTPNAIKVYEENKEELKKALRNYVSVSVFVMKLNKFNRDYEIWQIQWYCVVMGLFMPL